MWLGADALYVIIWVYMLASLKWWVKLHTELLLEIWIVRGNMVSRNRE